MRKTIIFSMIALVILGMLLGACAGSAPSIW